MHILTATDLLGIQTAPLDSWGRTLRCPWCKEEAWAAAEYFQCTSRVCEGQVASAEDILAHSLGSYEAAEELISRSYRRAPNPHNVNERGARRRVLDMWLQFCLTPVTARASQYSNQLAAHGLGINFSQFNCVILDKKRFTTLVQVATATGASFPDHWKHDPPTRGMAYCVQSEPHTIDRIVIIRGKRSVDEIVWNRYAAGFVSLIGLTPWKPRVLVSDYILALQMQHRLGTLGHYEEVCGMYRDTWKGGSPPPWKMEGDLLLASPRSPARVSSNEFHSPNDIAQMQEVLNAFPHVENNLRAMPLSRAINGRQSTKPIPWAHLRRGYINVLIGQKNQVPIEAATLFERTGTHREDAAFLISKYRREGRPQLADDVERLAQHRIFYRSNKITVRETANEYQGMHSQGVRSIANFSIKVQASVMFDDQSESFCRGKLNCGSASIDILFPQTLLQDRVNGLQDELQRQLSIKGHTLTANQLPTVIQAAQFRQFVIPHLKRQVAEAPLISGTDRLGWRHNGKSFVGPGFEVDVDGVKRASDILCPSISALRFFEAGDPWSSSCPQNLDKSCQDIISMILASCVRSFKRCVTKPILIQQSSDATMILDQIAKAMGQTSVYELNPNQRGNEAISGVYGYPIVTVGMAPANREESQPPHVLLTSVGYKPHTSPDIPAAQDGARALQFALMRVVEWCLATGADDFKERPSLDYNASLMREGAWLIENVCNLQPWEVSVGETSPMESLWSQIPFEETDKRISVLDGINMVVDLEGIEYDHDGILAEAKSIGANVAISEGKIYTPAAKMLPSITNFYGQRPKVKAVH